VTPKPQNKDYRRDLLLSWVKLGDLARSRRDTPAANGYYWRAAMLAEELELCDVLLGATTDAFVMFWERQREPLDDRFVPTHLFGSDWLAPELGATASVDSLVMILPRLLTTRDMRGGNASQMTIEQLAAAGIDASMVVIAPTAIDTREQTMDFVRDNIKRQDAFVLGLLSR